MGARAVSGHIGVFPQVNAYAVIDDALSHFPLVAPSRCSSDARMPSGSSRKCVQRS